jgi:hypothetical protein
MKGWSEPNLGLKEIPLEGFFKEWTDVNVLLTWIVGIGTGQRLLDFSFTTQGNLVKPFVVHKLSLCECDVCGKKFDNNDVIIFRGMLADKTLFWNNKDFGKFQFVTTHFGACDYFTQIRGLI